MGRKNKLKEYGVSLPYLYIVDYIENIYNNEFLCNQIGVYLQDYSI